MHRKALELLYIKITKKKQTTEIAITSVICKVVKMHHTLITQKVCRHHRELVEVWPRKICGAQWSSTGILETANMIKMMTMILVVK